MKDTWAARAAVKCEELNFGQLFERSKADFLVELLPFSDHPDFERAPHHFQQTALSCGWLAYNEKTVAVESKVVSPACMHIIDGEIERLPWETCRESASQALVDEAYHILLITSATAITREERQLTNLKVPQFELIKQMQAWQEESPEPWKRMLIQIACSIVSEVTVSDYLNLLGDSQVIQPLHTITTAIHRRDELAHNSVFKALGAMIYDSLNVRERDFFLSALSKPAGWFASAELDVWQSMLQQINFPNADRMIADCRDQKGDRCVQLDLSTLDTLVSDLGISDSLQDRLID